MSGHRQHLHQAVDLQGSHGPARPVSQEGLSGSGMRFPRENHWSEQPASTSWHCPQDPASPAGFSTSVPPSGGQCCPSQPNQNQNSLRPQNKVQPLILVLRARQGCFSLPPNPPLVPSIYPLSAPPQGTTCCSPDSPRFSCLLASPPGISGLESIAFLSDMIPSTASSCSLCRSTRSGRWPTALQGALLISRQPGR